MYWLLYLINVPALVTKSWNSWTETTCLPRLTFQSNDYILASPRRPLDYPSLAPTLTDFLGLIRCLRDLGKTTLIPNSFIIGWIWKRKSGNS